MNMLANTFYSSLIRLNKFLKTRNKRAKKIINRYGKLIDNYDNNKCYPGMFVKEESDITPLKDLMFNN